MFTIQNFIKPNYKLCPIEEMYFRLDDNCYYNSVESNFELQKFGKINFNTYFNVFSVTNWKSNCKIDDLYLVVQGTGKFNVRVYHQVFGQDRKLLEEVHVKLEGTCETIVVESWSLIQDGLLFSEITALSDGVISELSFVTQSKPVVDSKLGIVITHFNRKDYVLPSIKRINIFIKDLGLKEKIELVVVDNSNNITKDEGEGAVIIPNKNLGGSGGFMRGLLYLKDNGFTHCLFMDDDASCETESIFRSYQMLSYAKTKKLAIAGGLLDENKMNISLEKGSAFDGMSHILKSNYNMSKINHVLRADKEFHNIDYGGWWFFMFKIDDVEKLTFPYFVKGDDITFSIDNEFLIISPIGISCWAENFGLKSNPFSTYLWVRFLLIQPLLYPKYSFIKTIASLIKLGIALVLSGKYESVLAIIQANKDVRKGPVFWLENIDTVEIREKIKRYNILEKMQPIDLQKYNPVVFSEVNRSCMIENDEFKEVYFRKKMRKILVQGYILPFLLKNEIILQEKNHIVKFQETFRFKYILHYDFITKDGFITRNSFLKFWLYMAKILMSLTFTVIKVRVLKKSYKTKYNEMTSEDFWRVALEIEN